MGEESASGANIYDIYNSKADLACFGLDGSLPINETVHLHIFAANKLIYSYNAVSGYNWCKFDFTLEADLMLKGVSIDGEGPA
jgi:hypothetical protein